MSLSVQPLSFAQTRLPGIFPEARSVARRNPNQLRRARIPETARPTTVLSGGTRKVQELSLDNAIQIALANSDVIRVLGGVTAGGSGRTIYDPAITQTGVDRAQSVFDPTVRGQHNFNRNESPFFDTGTPAIGGRRSDSYTHSTRISKQTVTGAEAELLMNDNRFRTPDINFQADSSVSLSLSQPLLRGGGVAVNLSPIVVARIDTERSFFQLKDGLQSTVEGVIQAFWNLVQARLDVWTIEQQIEQAKFAFERETARKKFGASNQSGLAQTRLAYINFRANLISAQAAMLDREATLRSILGLPPSHQDEFVPTTPPSDQQQTFEWDELVSLAEAQRPDIIELKLILEADEQFILQARNEALPEVNAFGLYRWDGLEGELRNRTHVQSRPGEFADWQLGVNFSVPLGLRQSRANLRRQELILVRDQTNLDQAMLEVVHTLAADLRNLDQLFARYMAFRQTRQASEENLEQQQAAYVLGSIEYINVLQAITNWGNAVSSEAFALTQYNTALANLERDTGTILEVHGIRLFEERYRSIGPLGRHGRSRRYPAAIRPSENSSRYPSGAKPAEEFFDLRTPWKRRSKNVPPTPNEALPPPMPSS